MAPAAAAAAMGEVLRSGVAARLVMDRAAESPVPYARETVNLRDRLAAAPAAGRQSLLALALPCQFHSRRW
jgi:hypothetical protein